MSAPELWATALDRMAAKIDEAEASRTRDWKRARETLARSRGQAAADLVPDGVLDLLVAEARALTASEAR